MNRDSRAARKEALEAVRKSPKGMREAFCGFLQCELSEALAELENSRDTIGIWRAQGRAAELRELLRAIEKDG